MTTLVIIVNYKAATLTVGAVKSVFDTADTTSVQVVVVDNSDDRHEAAFLEANLPSPVDLIISAANIGFGRACNQALKGRTCDQVLLLNPDARLLPGCLSRLQRTLTTDQQIAAVSPRTYLDESRRFLLPPSYPSSWMIMETLIERIPWAGVLARDLLSRTWRRQALRLWRAPTPVKVGNLSGGLVLLKTKAIKNAGGLFDPAFFLYFEDTDLFLRLKKAGYTLLMEPRAEAIHFYNQCDQERSHRKSALMQESKKIFMQKHHTRWASFAASGHATGVLSGDPHGQAKMTPDLSDVFILDVPTDFQKKSWLFEFSPNRSLMPAVGHFGNGPLFQFPKACWRLLAPGAYFCRIGNAYGLGLNSQHYVWEVKSS